jgi:hypothetical protein
MPPLATGGGCDFRGDLGMCDLGGDLRGGLGGDLELPYQRG